MKTSLSRGTLYLTASSLLFALSGYATRIWLGNHFSPAEYGIYGVVISLNTALSLIASAGLPRSVSKLAAEDAQNADAILRSGLIAQLAASAAITVMLVLFAGSLAMVLNAPSMTPYLRLSALSLIPYAMLVLYWGYYNGLHRFKRVAVTNVLYSAAKVAFVIGLTYLFGLYGAIAGFTVASVIALGAGLKLPKGATRIPYRPMLFFSLPVLVLSILTTLLQSVDLWFVQALLPGGPAPGYYTASQENPR